MHLHSRGEGNGKKRVLLINPSTFMKNYGEYADAGGKSQPLGLAYIASVLEQDKNIFVNILDADVLNLTLEQTLRSINHFNPDIIGIMVLTTTYNKVVKLAEKIKEMHPHISIIVGGSHITALPETLKNKNFDIGVIGEGEYTFLELVKTLPDKSRLKSIKGIIYRENDKLIKTEPRELIRDLNELPFPANHLLPNIKRYRPQLHFMKKMPVAAMMTSRGCPFSCCYCDKSTFGSNYRARNPKNVVDEMEYLINKFGAKEITFFDDNFALIRSRTLAICDEIIRRKLKICWSCLARVDEIDEECIKKMKQAGCWIIAIGVESGNKDVLKASNKNISLDKVRKVVDLANKYGIKTRGFFMLGLPTETKQSIEDTINFAKSLNLTTAEFTICTPFPNTPLYHAAHKYGKLDKSDYSRFSQMFPVFVPNGLTADYLLKKQNEAHTKFYLRPSKILQFVFQIRNLGNLKSYFTGFKLLMRLREK